MEHKKQIATIEDALHYLRQEQADARGEEQAYLKMLVDGLEDVKNRLISTRPLISASVQDFALRGYDISSLELDREQTTKALDMLETFTFPESTDLYLFGMIDSAASVLKLARI